MNTQKIEAFDIIGIAVRTTNENQQAAKDIPALWVKFMKEAISEKIPNKVSNEIYCIYTEFEKDHTKPYTTILGCKVDNLENIPSGMIGKSIETSNYSKYVAKGDVQKGSVYNEWVKIWNSDLKRTFTNDIEVYGAKSMQKDKSEVDIFVAIE
nr:effector binding domain-containing protein [Bernardetia sp.]